VTPTDSFCLVAICRGIRRRAPDRHCGATDYQLTRIREHQDEAGLTERSCSATVRFEMFLSALITGSCEVRIAHAMPQSESMR
jgi:hypothetical protein